MTFAEYSRLPTAPAVVLVEFELATTIGYSFKDVCPSGSTINYEGRLVSLFDIGQERDPVSWGRLSFSSGDVTLQNADGKFDTQARSWWAGYYGKTVKIKLGYEGLAIGDYVTLWAGYIENVSHSVETVSFSLAEMRKKLDVNILDSWVDINALSVIKEAIMAAYPEITYTSTYFDTEAWEVAQTEAPNVSVDMVDSEKAIEVIDAVCSSIFGVFSTTADGKFTYVLPDLDATCETTIGAEDVLDVPDVSYDPSEVVSSVRVFCDIDKDLESGEYATIVEDTTRSAYVGSTYSIYNSKEILTYLPNATAAAAFAVSFLDYTCDVHGVFEISVPMKYYAVDIGDTIFVELNREGGGEYLGTPKCEVLGKTYMLDFPMIKLKLRQWYDEA